MMEERCELGEHADSSQTFEPNQDVERAITTPSDQSTSRSYRLEQTRLQKLVKRLQRSGSVSDMPLSDESESPVLRIASRPICTKILVSPTLRTSWSFSIASFTRLLFTNTPLLLFRSNSVQQCPSWTNWKCRRETRGSDIEMSALATRPTTGAWSQGIDTDSPA